jgi:hypothetical protein
VLELRTDMEEADKMWEEWFPDEKVRDFLMYTVAERMLLQVRKECFVCTAEAPCAPRPCNALRLAKRVLLAMKSASQDKERGFSLTASPRACQWKDRF